MRLAKGHTLIEMMVSLTLASLVLVGAISLFMAQAGVIHSETHRDQTAQEAQVAFDILSRLLRQAQADSISIAYTGSSAAPNDQGTLEETADAVRIDFTVPPGYPIWPADGVDNAIRIAWSNEPGAAEPRAIRIASANTVSTLADNDLLTLAGGDSGNTIPRVINLDFWPLRDVNTLQPNSNDPPLAGYLLSVTVRTAVADASYTNPQDPSGPLRHYRTYTAAGVVAPRN